MKKLLLPILLGFYALYSQNNLVFTDYTLKKTLLRSNVNSNFDQEISEEEALAVDSLEFDNYSFDFIEDPFTFEHSYSDLYPFKNLKILNIINDPNNSFKKLDLSHFPKLKKLSSFIGYPLTTNLSTLDSLESLDINQYGDTLNLQIFKNLKALTIRSSNAITLTLAPNLEKLDIANTALGSLDLSSLQHLKYLKLYNINQLASLDLSKSLIKASEVLISNCTHLELILFPDSKLIKLDLMSLFINDLDLSNTMIENGEIHLKNLTALRKFSIPTNKTVKTMELKEIDMLENLDLTNCMLPNGIIKIHNLNTLISLTLPTTALNLLELQNLSIINKIDLSQSILNNCKVQISNCSVLTYILTNPTNPIYELNLYNNGLIILDFKKQIQIERLVIHENKLQALELPSPNKLRFLDLSDNNNLKTINLDLFEQLDTLNILCSFINKLYLPNKSMLSELKVTNKYNNSKIDNIYNLKNQFNLKTLHLNQILTNSIIDISEMSILESLVYHSEFDVLNKSRFIYVKDTNQLYKIKNLYIDKFINFVSHISADQIECKEHFSNTMVCDDFNDAIPGNDWNDEYSILTDKPAWLYDQPNPYKKAEKGIFWVLPAQSNDFKSSKSRNTDGSLTFHITKTSPLVQPMMLTFGNYALGNKEEKFTIDLSNNAVVSFELSEIKNLYSNLIVELEDIHGNTLSIDKSAPEYILEENIYYEHYQIGIPIRLTSDQGDNKINGIQLNTLQTPLGNPKFLFEYNSEKAIHKFYYDFKNAKCGKFQKILPTVCCSDSMIRLIPTDAKFDYTNVALVKLMRTTNGEDLTEETDYSFTILNFRMGNTTQTIGIDSERIENSTKEIFKVYDIMGNFVAEGTWEQLMLNTQQLYILKSSERTVKVFVKE